MRVSLRRRAPVFAIAVAARSSDGIADINKGFFNRARSVRVDKGNSRDTISLGQEGGHVMPNQFSASTAPKLLSTHDRGDLALA